MAFPFDFIDEDDMTELINSANKVVLLQRTDGFGTSAPTLTLAANGTAKGNNTGGDIYSPQPLIASVGVSIGGSVIDLELVKGGSDMPRPAQGSFTVQGDILVNASVRNGMELIHRNITQDRNPAMAYAGGGTRPAEHTVVTSTALAGANDADKMQTVIPIPAAIKYEVEPMVVLTGTPAIKSGKLEAVVEVEGPDRNGVMIKRVARYNASNIAAGTKRGRRLFRGRHESNF